MHNFKELKIWQLGREFVRDIYNVTRNFPQEELYVLTSQLRGASVSIPSNIPEGAGRNSDKDFIRFLDIACGSAFELETQLYLCFDQGYLSEEILNVHIMKIQKIQKMLCIFRSALAGSKKSGT